MDKAVCDERDETEIESSEPYLDDDFSEEAALLGLDLHALPEPLMPVDMSALSADTRCGFISIIGAPNAGKSTLLNKIVGHKVSIVSRKVQTTRMQIKGIAIEGKSQLIFIDTPGIFRPKRRLDRAMVHAAWTGAADADKVVFVMDARSGICEDVQRIIDKLAEKKRKVTVVLNKIDGFDKSRLATLADKLRNQIRIEQLFMISALTGSGVNDLVEYLANVVPQGPWMYPGDQLTDLPLKLLSAEVTREQIFDRLHEELPYQMTVETEKVTTLKDGSLRLDQIIYVIKEGQRRILIGKDGTVLRQIGARSRSVLSRFLEKPVHLFLFVKVRENWQDDPERYSPWGLTFKI